MRLHNRSNGANGNEGVLADESWQLGQWARIAKSFTMAAPTGLEIAQAQSADRVAPRAWRAAGVPGVFWESIDIMGTETD